MCKDGCSCDDVFVLGVGKGAFCDVNTSKPRLYFGILQNCEWRKSLRDIFIHTCSGEG